MDFRELSNFFGGCIFPGHLGWDPDRLQEQLANCEVRLAARYNHEAQAGYHLVHAVNAMRAGHYVKAHSFLEAMAKSFGSILSPRWQKRHQAYSHMVDGLRRFPWAVQFRPDNLQPSSIIADASHDVRKAQGWMQNTVKSSSGTAATTPTALLDRIELQCIYKAIFTFHDRLWTEGVLHPHHPNKPQRELVLKYRTAHDFPPEVVFDASLLADLRSLQMDATARYFECLNIEMLRATASAEVGRSLGSLQTKCLSCNDAINRIMVLIQHGDELYSPSMTSPIALNLITEGALSGYEIHLWDRPDFEMEHRLCRNTSADRMYDRAFELAESIGCQHGMGLISLRRACLLHVEGTDATRELNERRRSMSDARGQLEMASAQFRSDHVFHTIVQIHSILLSISEGDHRSIHNRAEEIGMTCKAHNNGQLSRFAGILMVRFGRRQWLDHNRTDVFFACLSCARSCHDGADDTVFQYQVEIARAKLLCELGSIASAQSALQKARALRGRVMDHCETLKTSRPEYQDFIMGGELAIATYFDGVENSIRPRTPDPTVPQSDVSAPASLLSPEATRDLMRPATALASLAAEFSRAVATARAHLASADQDGYVSAIEGFLRQLESRSEPLGSIAAGYQVRALCLLDKYDEARALLPMAIPADLGGRANDDPSGKISSLKMYGVSFINENGDKTCERCLGHTVWARDWHKAGELLAKVLEHRPRFLSDLASTSLHADSDWQTQADVAAIYEHNDGLSEALAWYLKAQATLEKTRARAPAIEARLHAMDSLNSTAVFDGLIRVCSRFARMACLGLSKVVPEKFDLTGEDWYSQALTFAELSRARVLLDVLSLDDDDREIFAKEMGSSYRHRQREDLAWNQRPNVKGKAGATAWKQTPDEAERYPESLFSTALFLKMQANPAIEGRLLSTCLPHDCLALHYNVTDESTITFALSSKGLLRVSHSDLDRKKLRNLVLAHQRATKVAPRIPARLDEQNRGSNESSQLALHLLAPMADLIAGKKHIAFIPSHELNVFPFATLPFEGEALITRKCISQIPSLSVLRQLVTTNAARPALKPSVFVSQDKTILMATVAAVAVSDALDVKVKSLNRMSSDEFSSSFASANLVHIGTHGFEPSGGESPWQAYLQFRPKEPANDPFSTPEVEAGTSQQADSHSEGRWRVMQLAQMRTSAAVIIFSACLSAIGEVTQGNDMIGFSHALLQSGAQSYIGALWKANELSTMLLMMFLCRELDAGQHTTSVAECLRRAQIQLYKLTAERAGAMLEEADASWSRVTDRDVQEYRKEWVERCRNALRQAKAQLKHINFKDPYHWAAWIVVGNGDARLIHEPHNSESGLNGRASPLPVRPAELVPLHKIHSIDAAGVSVPQTPSISLTAAPTKVSDGEPCSEERPPPLPPRRASAPPSSSQHQNQTAPVIRRPVAQVPSRPSSVRPAPAGTGQTSHHAHSPPQRTPLSRPQSLQPQRPQRPQRQVPASPMRRRQEDQRGQQQPANRRPLPTANQRTNPPAIRQPHPRPTAPQQRHPASQPTTSRPAPFRSANPSPDPQRRQLGLWRRLMRHPTSQIAVRLGSGMLVGGQLGAQVGGIYDQWTGAEGSAPPYVAGGGGGLGLAAFGDGDEGGEYEGGGYEGGEYGGGEYDGGGYGGEEYEGEEYGGGEYEGQAFAETDVAFEDGYGGYEQDGYTAGDSMYAEDAGMAYDETAMGDTMYADDAGMAYDETAADAGGYDQGAEAQGGGGCIEDDPMYASLHPTGGYTM